jgi:hypothetical protein
MVIATGVTADGGREVLGLDVGHSEDGVLWTAFLRSLKARDLAGVHWWSPTPTPASSRPSRRSWPAPAGSGHLCRLPVGGRVPPAT